MRKYSKPDHSAPFAGKVIPLAITRIETQPVAANEPVKRGKLNYLGKQKAPPAKQKTRPSAPRTEHKTAAKGQYFGDGKRLTAFVWLDDVPTEDAANDSMS